MAGGFELGVLLGQYDGVQSFEQVGSWAVSNQTSLSLQTTDVHSSAQGGSLEVYSHDAGATGLQYDYGQANDAYERWSSDVTTHRLVAYAWAYIDTAGNSGDAAFTLTDVASAVIGGGSALSRYRLETDVRSEDGATFNVHRNASVDSYAVFMDDVLVAADVLDIAPDRDVNRSWRSLRSDAMGMGGTILSYQWGTERRWTLQVRFMPDSARLLVNRWWSNGWPVMFTWDGSDTSETYACFIEGDGAPFSRMMRPYGDLWAGTIRLRALTGGLIF